MTNKWEVEVRLDGRVVRRLGLGEVYEAAKVEGESVWVNGAMGGWISEEDIVLVEEALDLLHAPFGHGQYCRELPQSRHRSTGASGDADAAIEDFDAALKLSPSDKSIYNNRGNALSVKHEYDEAIDDYDFAILLDAEFAHAYNNRGNAWRAKGEHDKAIADYDEAIKIDRDYAYAYSNRGNAWHSKGDHEKAISDYDEAIEIDPRYAHAFNNRGSSWSALGEHQKAIADYTQAIKLNPKNAFAHNNLAWLLATCADDELRNGEESIRLAMEARQLNAGDWGVLDTLAAACAEAGQFEQAVEWIRQARKLAPSGQLVYLDERLADYQAEKPFRDSPPE